MRFSGGVFRGTEYSPNYDICEWVKNEVKIFFDFNKEYYQIKNPNFYFIQSDTINGVAVTIPSYSFICLTKGVIDYSSFIFRNVLRDNDFLAGILGSNEQQQARIIKYENFDS